MSFPSDPLVPARRAGRRPASSRAAIEEAAGELFLENTYGGTTIEQITTRAGVSRASFFNYFRAKSDLLWGDVDVLIADVASRLSVQRHDVAPLDGIRSAIISLVADITPDRIPLAITQWELMGVREDLLASGLPRFAALAAIVQRHLESRCHLAPALETRAAAFAVVGAVAAASELWASGGPERGSFSGMLDRAITPVCEGFARSVR
ncbi:MAG: TetR family transcriptional regulator [Burkholderiaceae bacterium]|nr:TetR family transcriptional regulator [Microbacteriaceae bacterium]